MFRAARLKLPLESSDIRLSQWWRLSLSSSPQYIGTYLQCAVAPPTVANCFWEVNQRRKKVMLAHDANVHSRRSSS